MIVLADAAVRADGNVYSGRAEIFVTSLGDLHDRSRLSAADPFLLPRDADRAAPNANFDEVGACVSEIEKSIPVYHVSGTDVGAISISRFHEFDRIGLPLGEAVRRVDAEHVRPGLDQGGYTFAIVARIDTGPDDQSLASVDIF